MLYLNYSLANGVAQRFALSTLNEKVQGSFSSWIKLGTFFQVVPFFVLPGLASSLIQKYTYLKRKVTLNWSTSEVFSVKSKSLKFRDMARDKWNCYLLNNHEGKSIWICPYFSYYIMVNGDLPFNINTHLLLPFAIVVVLCLIVILIFMVSFFDITKAERLLLSFPFKELEIL